MDEASIAHLSHWVAFYPSSISKCLGMGLICQRILLNVCSTLGFKICTCWAENLSPPSRRPPRGQTLLLVTLCFQAWLGEGHSLFCFGFSAGQELGLSGLAPPPVADVI